MSSYYISFVNYLDELGSLLKSVHKFLGILARNKKYANFSNHRKTWRWSMFLLKSFYHLFRFKASLLNHGVRERELHKPNLNLSIFCATELEVSVVSPPHLFSYLSLFNTKRKENKCNNIFLMINSLQDIIQI